VGFAVSQNVENQTSFPTRKVAFRTNATNCRDATSN